MTSEFHFPTNSTNFKLDNPCVACHPTPFTAMLNVHYLRLCYHTILVHGIQHPSVVTQLPLPARKRRGNLPCTELIQQYNSSIYTFTYSPQYLLSPTSMLYIPHFL